MKVDIKPLKNSELELTITVPYETYKKFEKKALEEVSKKVKIDGFRSGHIPEEVLREKVDEQALKATTLDIIFPQTYSRAVQENNLQVVAQPTVDIKSDVEKEGDDFVYTAKVAVMPEVKMGDYKKIKVERKPAKVEKEQIDETVQMIMDRYAEWKDVEREAKMGDRVEIAFEGFDEKDQPIPNTASKNHPLILGSKTMVPGFEDAVVGMKKGDEKEFEVTFPKEYHAEPMRGKKVKFKCTLSRLEEKTEQTLDDAWVEKITGQKQSVDDFKKRVESDLMAEVEQRDRADHDNAVVQEVIKITKVDIPEVLIDQELQRMKQDQEARVRQQGITWEQYLQHVKKTEEDFFTENRDRAIEGIKARLGVHHIIKDAGIKANDEEVDAKIEAMIATYPEDQQKAARDHFADPKNRANFKYNLAADKLIDMLSK